MDTTTKNWETLAANDPLWAVLVAPGTKNGRWDVDLFAATGQREVDAAMSRAVELVPGQRTLLRYPAPMMMTAFPPDLIHRTVDSCGGRILAAEADTTYGGHWHYTRYFVAPPAGQNPSPSHDPH